MNETFFKKKTNLLRAIFCFTILCYYNAMVFCQFNVSGTVLDAAKEDPLPGVNVYVKNGNGGTITGTDGRFNITVPGKGSILVFSYIGYLTDEIVVESQSEITIRMVEDITALDEVVVVGYGTQKRSDLTGAISSVKGEDLNKIATPSLESALQGKASGVYVTKASGAPGSNAKIWIRGPGSINNTDPLWIIDGIKSSAGPSFNMNDVESIEILKDASAAAIYGAEAANGVILVTTKKGEKAKPRVNISSYYGINSPMNLPEPLSTPEFGLIKNEAADLAGFPRIPRIADSTSWDTLPSTNWVETMYEPAPVYNMDVSVSGGNENMSFYFSGNYYKEEGTMFRSYFDRISLRMNSEYHVNKFITIGETFQVSRVTSDPASQTLENLFRAIPTMPVFDDSNPLGTGQGYSDPELDEYNGSNPYAMEDILRHKNKGYRIKPNIYVDIELFKGLSFNSALGSTFNFSNNRKFRDIYYFGNLKRETAELNQSFSEIISVTNYSTLTYARELGNHSFSVMGGYEVYRWDRESYSGSGADFPGGLEVLNVAREGRTASGSNDLVRKLSLMGRINYNYNDKYLFSSTIRRDGSSKFGRNKRYGYFPSFSFGWRMDKESFLDGLGNISLFKLRGSWGVLGSDNIPNFIPNALYSTSMIYYPTGGGTGQEVANVGARIKGFPNNDVKWEEIHSLNIGLDLNLFRDKIQFTTEYFVKNTKDILIDVAIPRSSGFTIRYTTDPPDPPINIGEIKNNGMEFNLTYKESLGDLILNVSGNLTYNKNEVLALNEDDYIMSGNDWGPHEAQFISRTEAGHPIGYFYGYVMEGIFQSQEEIDAANALNPEFPYQKTATAAGDIKFKDIAGRDENGDIINEPDGMITDADKTLIGNPWPKWVYGLNISATYKSLDLNVFFQGLADRDIYNGFKYHLENLRDDYNLGIDALNRWTTENTNTDVPRIVWNDPNENGTTPSTRYIEDGSYLRLKNVQLGYTVPVNTTSMVGISSLRLYMSGQNLFTLTKYSGMDPEFNQTGSSHGTTTNRTNIDQGIDAGIYARSRTVLFGIQLGF